MLALKRTLLFVKGGVVLRELINAKVHDYYWNQDLNCAITTLKILAELFYPKVDKQVLEAAFGLNAGRCGNQCGLVEGTLLFIGIYGAYQHRSQEQIKEVCHDFCNQFQVKFGSLLCAELRPEGFHPNNPPHLCEKLTKEAVSFAAKFIKEKMC